MDAVYNTNGNEYYEIGMKDDHGLGCYHKAFEAFKEAAEMGHTEAQYALAVMYYRGRSVDQNLEEAKKWFKLAGEGGHEFAMRRYTKLKDLKEIPDGDYICNSITTPDGSIKHIEKRQEKCPKCELEPHGLWPFDIVVEKDTNRNMAHILNRLKKKGKNK